MLMAKGETRSLLSFHGRRAGLHDHNRLERTQGHLGPLLGHMGHAGTIHAICVQWPCCPLLELLRAIRIGYLADCSGTTRWVSAGSPLREVRYAHLPLELARLSVCTSSDMGSICGPTSQRKGRRIEARAVVSDLTEWLRRQEDFANKGKPQTRDTIRRSLHHEDVILGFQILSVSHTCAEPLKPRGLGIPSPGHVAHAFLDSLAETGSTETVWRCGSPRTAT
ncbi:hypothetical protein BV20DRAFT_452912 [Pilatotrama ljubarskyi]|nr:hypothetical protein BV20DRAFT_452912 [Pilatotrama ljubarskyi]